MTEQAAVPVPKNVKPLLTVLIMLCTLMVILDSTIAVVALPHMQAALGASPDTISWVLTSYITATAIAMPLTGWLSGRIGRRNLFIASTLLFTISSALCGVAATLPLMVAARIAQGFTGAFIAPLSQSFMYDINAPKDQVRAITIWGIGAMVGPVIGPVIGGYLTDTFDWRWVFFINVPLGIIAVIGALAMLPRFTALVRPFDKIGYILLGILLASVQLILDRGTSLDWFQSNEIMIEAAICVAVGWMLAVHLRRAQHPIVPAALFQNRNFNFAIILVFCLGGLNAAGSALIAPMAETLFRYPVFDAGVVLMPRGASMMVAMVAAGWLIPRIDTRIIIAVGMCIIAYGSWLTSGFTLMMGSSALLLSSAVLGFGTGLAIMPINLLSASTLPVELRTDCAAVYNLARNLGASMVVSITSALLARNLQINHAELAAHVTTGTLPLAQPGIVEQFGLNSERVVAMVDAEINRQSLMIAYIDDYWLLSVAMICLLPMLIFLKPTPARRKGETVMMAE